MDRPARRLRAGVRGEPLRVVDLLHRPAFDPYGGLVPELGDVRLRVQRPRPAPARSAAVVLGAPQLGPHRWWPTLVPLAPAPAMGGPRLLPARRGARHPSHALHP